QLSLCVHASPSSHTVPSAATGLLQAPVLGSHVPATWHWSSAVHTTGSDPAQLPCSQLSLCVHASPSSHTVPSAATGLLQAPVAGSHVPTSWHWSSAVHTTGSEPAQLPCSQLSLCVHASPSSHTVPSAATGLLHTPVVGSHVHTSWHWSSAVHTTGSE